MHTRRYNWRVDGVEHAAQFALVPGTAGAPYLFGRDPNRRPIEISPFHMLTTPVTQALWTHVMGSNPAVRVGPNLPVENISWAHITEPGGFLDRINASPVLAAVASDDRAVRFRLPSETEWEYAARGGPHWRDEFAFSGSHDADAVAWYGPRFTRARRMLCQSLGWRIGWRLAGRFKPVRPTQTHDVATKAPNQLGLYDMCGNVSEWCQDAMIDEVDAIPRDGTPGHGTNADRRLRGGCHHNWDIHCTVWYRYGLDQESHDGCIGFRLVLAA